MKRNIWSAMAMMAAMSAAPALAQERPSPTDRQIQAQEQRWKKEGHRAESDQALANQIASKVRRYVSYTIFDDVQIGVDQGVATLSGRVTMPYKAKDLGRIVARVPGVLEVKNEITTLPVSISDDRLRRSLARQIYRDSLFSTYAFQAYPPIHIVVENGRVTLAGAVSSEVERVKAEMIARTTFGVFNVENRLIVAL